MRLLHEFPAYASLALVVLFSLRGRREPVWAAAWLRRLGGGGEAAYAAALLGCLLLFRWPVFFVQRALDADEAQFIAGAMTLWLDPVFWRSVDGQTAGPLIYYALMPLELFGLLNYTGARLVGCLLIFGTLWFSYRSLLAWTGESLARLCLLPAVFFFAFTTHSQFVHYTNEHVPLLLLALGLSGLAPALAAADLARFPTRGWLLAGVALGAVPFAKLQAVPPAALWLLAAVAWLLTRRELPWPRRRALLAALAAAVCLIPAGFALMLTAGDAWVSFWNSYFVDNLAYLNASVQPAPAALGSLVPFLRSSSAWFVMIVTVLAVAALALARADFRDPRRRWPLLLVAGSLAANIPFTLFVLRHAHYLLFLVMPAVLLAGVALAQAWQSPATAPWHRRLLLGVFVAGLAAQLALKTTKRNSYLGEMAGAQPVPRAVARAILGETAPGDRMAVWGWHAELHVETGLPQATSNSNSVSQVMPSIIQRYFLARYASELRLTRPRIFVDVPRHARALHPPEKGMSESHDQFPEIASIVAEHYTQIAAIDGVRLYRRTSR